MKVFSKNRTVGMLVRSILFLCVFVQVFTLSEFSLAHAKGDGFDGIIREAEDRRFKITKTMEESTVFIFWTDDNDDISMGTGFVVGDGYILTNGHVVDGGTNFYVSGKNFSAVKAKLIKMVDNDVDDFAVLRFNPPVALPVLSFNLALNRSERVSAWGFPSAYTQFDKSIDALVSGDSDAFPPVITTEGIVNAFITTSTEMESILHSANIAKGNSGGPLINSRGHVVGINTWVSTEEGEGSHVNAALTARAAIAFMRSVGVEPKIVGGEDIPSPHVAENKKKRSLRDRVTNPKPEGSESNEDVEVTSDEMSGDDLTGDARKAYSVAVKGNAEMQAFLGLSYWEGESAPKDLLKSLYWLKKAVDKGNTDAKALLGYFYITEPDYFDPQAGIKLLEQAAEEDAEYASGYAFFIFRGEMLGITRDVEKAVRAAKRGVEVGDAEAMALLALFYCTADGVESNPKYAFELAEKAAKEDIGLAYAVMSWIHYDGDIGPENNEKALELAKKAAAKDESLGKALLSLYHYEGAAAEQDLQKAFEYATEAAEGFDETGQYLLGLLYADKDRGKPDNVKAWAYLDMAARKNVSNAEESREEVAKEMSSKEIKEAKELVKQWHSHYGLAYTENY